MLRFIAYAVPLLILLLALFGFTVELLDAEPRKGSVIRLALFEQPRVPGQLVIGTWLVEASGLIALFLLAQGRFGTWWLDGLVAGWVAWVFRGPLLVITIVVAARQAQDPWWKLAFGWWVLYSVCGLSLAILARRSGLAPWTMAEHAGVEPEAAPAASNEQEVELDEPEGASAEAKVDKEGQPAVDSEVESAESESEETEPAEPESEDTESPEAVAETEQIESAGEPEEPPTAITETEQIETAGGPEEPATPVVEASDEGSEVSDEGAQAPAGPVGAAAAGEPVAGDAGKD